MTTQTPTTHRDTATQPGYKFFGQKGLIVVIAYLSAFAPASTDLYLPAIPSMARYFGTTADIINLTLILFFLFYSAGMLFWGPMSDRYGRKPILTTGLILYTVACIACALSANVVLLIIARAVQGIGAGAVTANATAIVKDLYRGRQRETVLAWVQTMVIVAPIVAPVVGGAMLQITSWRGVFWIMACFGGVGLLAVTGLTETLQQRFVGGIFRTVGRLGVVLKNPGFSILLFIFSLPVLPMMGYLASCSYIYIDRYGLSEQAFSYFFALNALFGMTAPALYMMLSKRISRHRIIIAGFASAVASGLLISTIGTLTPLLFAIAVLPSTLLTSMLRTPATHILLEQQREDTGSASSLINASGTLFGAFGMMLISLDWGNMVIALGMLNLTAGLLAGVLWLIFSRRSFVRQPE